MSAGVTLLERETLNNPTYERIVSVSAKSQGAVGDGVTDDTAAIQAVIDELAATPALSTSTTGRMGQVIIPPGLFVISGLTRPGWMTLCGVGKSSKLILKANPTVLPDAMISLTDTGSDGREHGTVHNLWLDGNYANQTQTTLGAAISTATGVSVSITLNATTGPAFSARLTNGISRLRCEGEIFLVTAGAGTTTLTGTRGYNDTTKATHASGVAVQAMTDGVHFDNTIDATPTGVVENHSQHVLHDLYISYITGHGMHLSDFGSTPGVMGGARAHQVYVRQAHGYSFYLNNCNDGEFTQCFSLTSGLQGFMVKSGGNNILGVCKAAGAGKFWSPAGDGFSLQAEAQLVGCQAQDNANHGFYISSSRVVMSGAKADSNGNSQASNFGGTSNRGYGYYFDGAQNCDVEGTAHSRFTSAARSTLQYADMYLAPGTADNRIVVVHGTTATNNDGNSAEPNYGDTLLADIAANNKDRHRVLRAVADGAGAVVPTGAQQAYVSVPCNAKIVKARVLADQPGSVVFDVWKDAYANFPPDVADTITASAKPTLATAQKSEDTVLSGWTTRVSAGDVIEVNVDSAATCTRAILELTLVPFG